MGLKIFILTLSTILAFLAIDFKKISENKIKTGAIFFVLILSFIFTAWDYKNEALKSQEKDKEAQLQHYKDSLLRVNEQRKLYTHIDSINIIHKKDSVQLVICNAINNYNNPRGKNINMGDNLSGHVGDVTNITNSEPELTNKDKSDIEKRLNTLKKQFNPKNKDVVLTITNTSNAHKYYDQFKAFLISKGYKIIMEGPNMINLNNVNISYSEGCCYSIVIGTLD